MADINQESGVFLGYGHAARQAFRRRAGKCQAERIDSKNGTGNGSVKSLG